MEGGMGNNLEDKGGWLSGMFSGIADGLTVFCNSVAQIAENLGEVAHINKNSKGGGLSH
jgi:hypothetical protein